MNFYIVIESILSPKNQQRILRYTTDYHFEDPSFHERVPRLIKEVL